MASRLLITLGEQRTARLDVIAEQRGASRSALVREAVDRLIDAEPAACEQERRLAALRAGFGAWKDRIDIGDAVEWQRRERAGSARHWDDDYEGVKAEYPDLFDAEDDRQQKIHLDMLAGKFPTPILPPFE